MFGKPKEIIVVGLGNPLMGDEGIGIELIDRLSTMNGEGKFNGERIDFHDGGTGGMNLLHAIAERKKAILIDCALMGTEPGTIVRFTPDDVQTIKKLSHLTLHEVDILKVIDIARQLDQCPDEVVFFGIEPALIAQQMSLTPMLQAKLDEYIDIILHELPRA